MRFRTVGRVIDKWCLLPALAFEGWIWPMPLHEGEQGARRYFLRVVVLHPQTEQASRWTVPCSTQAQWERYDVGSWLRLRIGGRALLRYITIEE
jgi:hypothetical protein